MVGDPSGGERQPGYIEQNVSAVAGNAYGIVGDADIHVFGDGLPVYLLTLYRSAPATDARWLRQLPSRMLNARHEVVEFTGRSAELDDLKRWAVQDHRLAARWLHGPGGQGKTRLAAAFAEDRIAAGWKVVVATHGPGTVLAGVPPQQDLRLDGHAGVLLIVDYADRWPLSHLTWLMSNKLLHHELPTRILLLARSDSVWPRVRSTLANHQADTSSQLLRSLGAEGDDRRSMFARARDAFAARYDVADPQGIGPPGSLDDPDMGLTLALHIAALVAVDAHVEGRRPPADMAGATVYLLDREQLHWALLAGDGTHELGGAGERLATPPEVMNQAVFVAALTGMQTQDAAAVALNRLSPAIPPEVILTDHALCYPPADANAALEPLYPDRLAEDFLALTLPGHHADYPQQPWASSAVPTLLQGENSLIPNLSAAECFPDETDLWIPRAINFLAAAAARWPHVGTDHLYPLLRQRPRLLVAAGGAAMHALARIDDIDMDVFESFDRHMPQVQVIDMDGGAAAIADRLTAHRLATTSDGRARADIYRGYADRLEHAGRRAEALAATEKSLALLRETATNREIDPYDLAGALTVASYRLSQAGRHDEAIANAQEAVDLCRTLAANERRPSIFTRYNERRRSKIRRGKSSFTPQPADPPPPLALVLNNLSLCLLAAGQVDASLTAAKEAVRLLRRMNVMGPTWGLPELGSALVTLGNSLSQAGRDKDALKAIEEAVSIRRGLVRSGPAIHYADLAISLGNQARALMRLGRGDEGIAVAAETAAIYRDLAEIDPAAFGADLAAALCYLGICFAQTQRHAEAADTAEEAITVARRLARLDPSIDPTAAQALAPTDLTSLHTAHHRHIETIATAEEAVSRFRQAVALDTQADAEDFMLALHYLSEALRQLGRVD
ncbi:hypothetical protein ACTMTJ_21655 [Phytohabitans sp. LJ34]|uniref:hypothetical protein n=1 Tax=Phytohabitans sp. LJ34 TaxID=3452217 RepID=UPI003F89FB42